MAQPAQIKLDYDLPPLTKSLQQGWITSCENAAVVSALVAAIVAQLMSTMGLAGSSDGNIFDPAATKALTVFAYSALLLSCSSTISALLLIDELGALPFSAVSKERSPNGDDVMFAGVFQTLEDVGMRSSTKWVRCHWLFSLTTSIGCMILQIILYIWLSEGLAVKIVLLIVTIFAVLPFLFLIRRRR